jgi:flagellar protein FlbD
LIEVTKLNKARLVVNADLIEFVEQTPDTMITLTTGRKIMVRESIAEVLERVHEYRGRMRAYPVPVAGGGDRTPPRKRPR